jgi:hypothetical protein
VEFAHVIFWLLKKPYGKPILAALLITVGVLFGLFFLPNFDATYRLEHSHAFTRAVVIASRVSRGQYLIDKSYDLQYRFQTARHGVWYIQTERGPLARNELWSTLPKEAWDQAVATGHVAVAYLPENPNVNALAADLPTLLRYIWIGIVFAVVPFVAGIVWLVLIVARWIFPSTKRKIQSGGKRLSMWKNV